jgi:hypothetical protein
MAHDFRFSPKVVGLLGQIGLVREARSICREGGPLANEFQGLMNHLRRELPGLVPGMLLASVVDDVQQFSPHEQHDDITLIVAKCRAD